MPDRFDLVVIGGGSGGIAAAREAAALGGKVALLDHVSPSTQGNSWGLGGTCANVGCVPKKLMHHAATLGHAIGQEAPAFGWDTGGSASLDWGRLRDAVSQYIASTAFGYTSALRDEGVHFIQAAGCVSGRHVEDGLAVDVLDDERAPSDTLDASHVILATGTRPFVPDIPGAAELGITSDDLFTLPQLPGRVLVVGGGYIALECAGFLRGLGSEVTVVNRSSTFLRGFDEDLAAMAVQDLSRRGVRVVADSSPTSLRRSSAGGALVARATGSGGHDASLGEFDAVLFATGRRAPAAVCWSQDLGHAVETEQRKIKGGFEWPGYHAMPEASSLRRLFAVGDVLHDNPELTPVAIHQGVRVARTLARMEPWHSRQRPPAPRPQAATHGLTAGGGWSLAGIGSTIAGLADGPGPGPGMDGEDSPAKGPTPASLRRPWQTRVPMPVRRGKVGTAVFTPCELASIGLTEAEAAAEHGNEGIEVVWSRFDTLERSLELQQSWSPEASEPQNLVKVVARSDEPWRVLGVHLAGAGASEAIQGYAVAVTAGVGLADLQDCVGVHPTASEEGVVASVTKSSGRSPVKSAC